jgi:hypothetical protein
MTASFMHLRATMTHTARVISSFTLILRQTATGDGLIMIKPHIIFWQISPNAGTKARRSTFVRTSAWLTEEFFRQAELDLSQDRYPCDVPNCIALTTEVRQ